MKKSGGFRRGLRGRRLVALLRAPRPGGVRGLRDRPGRRRGGGEAQRVTVSADGILVSAEAETIGAAPAFSADDLMAEPRESWITNGWHALQSALLAPREDRRVERVGAEGCLASAAARFGNGGEVFGGGAADRARRRDLCPNRSGRRVRGRRRDRADSLAIRSEARSENQHCLRCGWTSRGVALGDGKLYVGQLDPPRRRSSRWRRRVRHFSSRSSAYGRPHQRGQRETRRDRG